MKRLGCSWTFNFNSMNHFMFCNSISDGSEESGCLMGRVPKKRTMASERQCCQPLWNFVKRTFGTVKDCPGEYECS